MDLEFFTKVITSLVIGSDDAPNPHGIHMAASNHHDIIITSHQFMCDGIIAAFQLAWVEQ